jgi:GT2 family glycosyltransferase
MSGSGDSNVSSSSTMSDIHIIILNWNGLEDTLECLSSVEKITYKTFRATVVDNGSTDGSVENIRLKFPEVTVIENEKNLGFAEGNNVGIRYALNHGADYVFILNNDTVVAPDILSAFLDVAENSSHAGIVGGKILFHSVPNRIWFAGGKWVPNQGHCIHVGWGETDDGLSFDAVTENDCVSGCAMFVKRIVAEKVGLFAPEFYLTFEDTDWCFRARKQGYQCLYAPKAKVWHKVSATFGGKTPIYSYYFERNRLLWAKRNLSLFQRFWVYKQALREFGYYLRHENDKGNAIQCVAKLLGFRDYLTGKFGKASKAVLKRLS